MKRRLLSMLLVLVLSISAVFVLSQYEVTEQGLLRNILIAAMIGVILLIVVIIVIFRIRNGSVRKKRLYRI